MASFQLDLFIQTIEEDKRPVVLSFLRPNTYDLWKDRIFQTLFHTIFQS